MTIRKAATVVLLRGEQDFEVFMVRRHGKSGFMAGAHVFPGGVVDASDAEDFARTDGRSALECAKKLRLSQADATAAFVAAVRETFEESGVALGDMKNESAAEDERAALNDGKAFRDVLDGRLDADAGFEVLAGLARGSPFSNGFYHGTEGVRLVAPIAE